MVVDFEACLESCMEREHRAQSADGNAGYGGLLRAGSKHFEKGKDGQFSITRKHKSIAGVSPEEVTKPNHLK